MIEIFNSPYIVPVAGCAMVLGLGAFGIFSEIEQKKMRMQERMSMVARGMSPDEIEKLMGSQSFADEAPRDPLRGLGNARRTATVLLSSGAGIIVFGLLLAAVLQLRALLIVPAGGFIPIAIGLGFLADYRMQTRELKRFGLEVGGESSPGSKY